MCFVVMCPALFNLWLPVKRVTVKFCALKNTMAPFNNSGWSVGFAFLFTDLLFHKITTR